MKKKMISLALAAALLVGATIPAMAAKGGTEAMENDFISSPSGGQKAESDDEEIEIVTDNVVSGGYIRQKGTTESRPLDQIDYPVIKITTLNMSATANAEVDAANPGATQEQKSGVMTQSGLSYGKNAKVNETAERYYASDTTGDFVDEYQLSFFDRLVSMAEGSLKGYSAIQMADISANTQAISTNRSVRLTLSAPGVKAGSQVKVARIQGGSMEFVTAQAGNGTISFDVYPSNLGVFVLLTHAEQ